MFSYSHLVSFCLVLSDVVIVSIAGGIRDNLVRSDLCALQTLSLPDTHALTVFPTSIAHVWLSTDHQCSMWCNQVVKAITRCMIELIHAKTLQCTKTTQERLD